MSAAGFVMRALVPEDLPGLTNLWVAAWRAIGLPVDFEARRPWLAAHLVQLAADGAEIIVAEDARGGLAGFVTIDRQSGFLDQLCVAPERQGSGIARLLLGEARSRAPGVVRLEVNSDNPRARQLYLRAGFVETGKSFSSASGLPTLQMEWRDASGLRSAGTEDEITRAP